MAELPHSPAAERNREPILALLRQVLPATGRVLEIGAGSGQHAVYFAAALGRLQWCPSEHPAALPGLAARIAAEGGANIEPPRALDVSGDDWPSGPFAAAYTANTCHIMAWPAVVAMFEGVAARLVPGGPFAVYGPFNRDGAFTADSNRRFDAQLRAADPGRGLRDIEALESLARRQHLALEAVAPMPAENFTLVFRRESAS